MIGTPPALRRIAVLLAAAIALFWQGLVVQTHVHPASAIQARAVHGPSATVRDHRADDDPATCALCQELAAAGHYIAPDAQALDVPALSFPAPVATLAASTAPPQHSHAWRGRGPPPMLQQR